MRSNDIHGLPGNSARWHQLRRGLLFVASAAVLSFTGWVATGLPNAMALVGVVAAIAVSLATCHFCSCWAAIGTGSYLVRAASTFFVCLLVASSGFLGCLVALGWSIESEAYWSASLAFGPLLWLSGQLPFLLVGRIAGWQLVWRLRDESGVMVGGDQLAKRQLSIADYMTMTLCWAIVLACSRFFAPQVDDSGFLWESAIYLMCANIVWLGLLAMPTLGLLSTAGSDMEAGCLRIVLLGGGLLVLLIVLSIPWPGVMVACVACALVAAAYEIIFGIFLMYLRLSGIVLVNRWSNSGLIPSEDGADHSNALRRQA